MRIGCALFILLVVAALGGAGWIAFGDPPQPSTEIRQIVTPDS